MTPLALQCGGGDGAAMFTSKVSLQTRQPSPGELTDGDLKRQKVRGISGGFSEETLQNKWFLGRFFQQESGI